MIFLGGGGNWISVRNEFQPPLELFLGNFVNFMSKSCPVGGVEGGSRDSKISIFIFFKSSFWLNKCATVIYSSLQPRFKVWQRLLLLLFLRIEIKGLEGVISLFLHS